MLKPANKEELKKIIENHIQIEGPKCDLNDIDVSGLTDMSDLFKGSKFNGNISKWDVSNVTNMSNMFEGSPFNGDIIRNWKIRPDCDTKNMFGKKVHKPLTEEDMKNFRARLESMMNAYEKLCKRREAQAKCEADANAANKNLIEKKDHE